MINKKTKLENKKGRGQYSPPLNKNTKNGHGKRGGHQSPPPDDACQKLTKKILIDQKLDSGINLWEKLRFEQVRGSFPPKVKFKTGKFYKIKLMRWTIDGASFQDLLFMGNLAQVPKKKVTSLCKYLNLARNYSHYQKQKIMLTSRMLSLIHI